MQGLRTSTTEVAVASKARLRVFAAFTSISTSCFFDFVSMQFLRLLGDYAPAMKMVSAIAGHHSDRNLQGIGMSSISSAQEVVPPAP